MGEIGINSIWWAISGVWGYDGGGGVYVVCGLCVIV